MTELKKEKDEWVPREGYALTLDEIHFLFEEYLQGYHGCNGDKMTVQAIETLRGWITNAAISGKRLQ